MARCPWTRAGAEAAKARNVKFGCRPKLSPQQIIHARKLIDAGDRRQEVAALFGVGRKRYTSLAEAAA